MLLDDIRRRRLQEWIDTKYDKSRPRTVKASGMTKARFSQLLKVGARFGETSARALETRLGMKAGYLDQPYDELTPQARALGEALDALKDAGRRKRAYATCKLILTLEDEPRVTIEPYEAPAPAKERQRARQS